MTEAGVTFSSSIGVSQAPACLPINCHYGVKPVSRHQPMKPIALRPACLDRRSTRVDIRLLVKHQARDRELIHRE